MTIGVVIPAYQVERWVERCLRSVLDQSVPADEIVVVDDGSTDATPALASAMDGVTLVQQENGGLAAARNAGTRASSSDWIFFLDADDMMLPDAIAAYQDAIERWPNASVIDPAYESEYPDGRVVRPPHAPDRAYRREHLTSVIRRNPLTANAVIKRELAGRYPYDTSYRACEDLKLWFTLLLDAHEIVQMGVPTTRRSIGREGALSNRILTMRRCRSAVFRELWREPRLTARERAMLAYQISRVSAGIAVARIATRTDAA
ncbi:MAG: glycosyltransferase family 2 protein [Actinomycetota bacterium]